jgi:hypothetical protein
MSREKENTNFRARKIILKLKIENGALSENFTLVLRVAI